jgi:hypothetical protein
MGADQCVQCMAAELRAVIGLNHGRQTSRFFEAFQHSHYALAIQACINFQSQAFPTVTIDKSQSPKASPAAQRVTDEVSARGHPATSD